MSVVKAVRVCLVIFFCALLLGDAHVPAATRSVRPKAQAIIVGVKIGMKQDTFRVDGPAEGKVVLRSDAPANLPGVFQITMKHDGLVTYQAYTSVSVPRGTTAFSFKHFGIPMFNRGPDSVGLWQITIVQQGLDAPQAAEVEIRVVPGKK